MDTLTNCTICYYRYSHISHIPLILSCGHTFCKTCITKITKCPQCRNNISSTAINRLLLQKKHETKDICFDSGKNLFCPQCDIALCLNCLSNHGTHGIISIKDPNLSSIIKESLDNSYLLLLKSNKKMQKSLEKIQRVKDKIVDKKKVLMNMVNDGFDNLIILLQIRKQEIVSEIERFYTPASSKIDYLLCEIEVGINKNNEEIESIYSIKDIDIKKQLDEIKPFKSQSIDKKLMKKVFSQCRSI
ncbi:hypothetical protein SteCoe_27401 [Stentor coeruleus]|uniref:RING-type domain-containing protein n=1 Tax=Stentor coeruleus TaxID=5963 RepID=A0A1R2BAM2_9CILI|nr:hypothetical protein SteCoe_27401 [Stentor coeruleus]